MDKRNLISLLALSSAILALSSEAGGIEAIKALKIEHAVTQVVHVISPVMVDQNGNEHHNLPPRTIVKTRLNPVKGSEINIEIWLPEAESWNRKFVGLGNGGAAGGINPVGFLGAIKQGFAVATTDMGTAPDANSGIGNHEVWKDFGFRSTHLMTVTAKLIIQTFYGKGPEFSYFVGNSTGGQQALQEAQCYPEDYDGIVAGVPAHCRTPLHAYFLWNHQILEGCPFTPEQERNVITAANEYMAKRETPQFAGQFISDPRCTDKDIEAVIKLALSKDSSLTAKHANALRRLFGGPRHAITGEQIFDGIPLGSAFGPARGNLYLFNWVFGANQDLTKLNFGQDFDTYTMALGQDLNANNPDLQAFEERGGKLLLFSGTTDSCVPYHATLDYYEQVIESFGSLEKVQQFCRFYLIPGKDHGGGGPGANRLPDFLSLMINWREKGTAPDVINCQRYEDEKLVFHIPVYPYPQKTIWNSQTQTFEAAVGIRGGVSRIVPPFPPKK